MKINNIKYNNDGSLIALSTDKQTYIMYINYEIINNYLKNLGNNMKLPEIFEIITVINYNISSMMFIESALV